MSAGVRIGRNDMARNQDLDAEAAPQELFGCQMSKSQNSVYGQMGTLDGTRNEFRLRVCSCTTEVASANKVEGNERQKGAHLAIHCRGQVTSVYPLTLKPLLATFIAREIELTCQICCVSFILTS